VSRPNTTATPFDGVASSSIFTENTLASLREASNTQLVTTSQSSYSGGGMDGTTSDAARNAVVNVMVRSPSMSVAATADVNPW